MPNDGVMSQVISGLESWTDSAQQQLRESWTKFEEIMTPGTRIMVSLFFSCQDWVFDFAVIADLFKKSHPSWAWAMIGIMVFTGVAQTVLMAVPGTDGGWGRVRGLRLGMYLVGLGIYSEALMFFREAAPEADLDSDDKSKDANLQPRQISARNRFLVARCIETAVESTASGALQVYIAFYIMDFSTLKILSIISSILAIGYGMAATLADFPNGTIQSVTRGLSAMVYIFSLVVLDFLWRVLLFALYSSVAVTGWQRYVAGGVILFFNSATAIYGLAQEPADGPIFHVLIGLVLGFACCFTVTPLLFLVFIVGPNQGTMWNRIYAIGVNYIFQFAVNVTLILALIMGNIDWSARDTTNDQALGSGSGIDGSGSMSSHYSSGNVTAAHQSFVNGRGLPTSIVAGCAGLLLLAPLSRLYLRNRKVRREGTDIRLPHGDQEPNDLVCLCW